MEENPCTQLVERSGFLRAPPGIFCHRLMGIFHCHLGEWSTLLHFFTLCCDACVGGHHFLRIVAHCVGLLLEERGVFKICLGIPFKFMFLGLLQFEFISFLCLVLGVRHDLESRSGTKKMENTRRDDRHRYMYKQLCLYGALRK